MNINNTNGIISSFQTLDWTGMPLIDSSYTMTGSTKMYALYDGFKEINIEESISEKINAIREKSHVKFGEAWSKLAEL